MELDAAMNLDPVLCLMGVLIVGLLVVLAYEAGGRRWR